MYQKLDNPVYHSLNEYHKNFCLHFRDCKFYNPEVAAFGGSLHVAKDKDIAEYLKICNDFLIFGVRPQGTFTKVSSQLVCDQYVLEQKTSFFYKREIKKNFFVLLKSSILITLKTELRNWVVILAFLRITNW
jgi:hypothetical protein